MAVPLVLQDPEDPKNTGPTRLHRLNEKCLMLWWLGAVGLKIVCLLYLAKEKGLHSSAEAC